MKELLDAIVSEQVARALLEDLHDQRDITAQLVPETTIATAQIICREQAILCGEPWVNETFFQLDAAINITWHHNDEEPLDPNTIVCTLQGPARSLLTGERTALNFLQLLSGTATTAYHYNQKLLNTQTKLLDTRKTIPGLRLAQKYAVRCGGGHNHRLGLYDAFLIKENHIAAAGSISAAIATAHTIAEKPVEIEIENLSQLQEALVAKADIVMLDNFTLSAIKEAVTLTNNQAKLEVSGNITIDNLVEVAATGVDYISVGALTKNVKAIDFTMLFQNE